MIQYPNQNRPGRKRPLYFHRPRQDYSQFVKEFIANGWNGTQAVLKVWPYHTYGGARHKATILLANHHVMSEIIKGLPTLEELGEDYSKVKKLALKSDKLAEFIKATDSQVRMQAGFTDKVEGKMRHGTLESEEKDELGNLRAGILENKN